VLTSLPVLLGTLGGIGLLIGPAGLSAIDRQKSALDVVFLALLFLTSLTGLLLLALRESPAMGPLLIVHLAIVLTLFLTLPYGKFVHSIYRFAALIRSALEKSR